MLTPDDFEHRYLPINGFRMHYVQAGTGPRLMLMLHGFPENWWSWRHQIPVFARHFTVVAPDLRGYNESEKPAWGYGIDVLVEDIVELIRALGHERAVVAAHDWGGMLGWSLAIARPWRVERLIALNMPHPALFQHGLLTNARQRKRSYYILLFQFPWLAEAMFRANDYALVEQVFRGAAINQAAFTDADIRYFKAALARPGALTAALNYYRALVQERDRGFFRGTGMRVHVPTQLIWGENDQALGKELTEGTHDLVPDLRLDYIPNCSHWVQQDCPAEVNRLMLDFLGLMDG